MISRYQMNVKQPGQYDLLPAGAPGPISTICNYTESCETFLLANLPASSFSSDGCTSHQMALLNSISGAFLKDSCTYLQVSKAKKFFLSNI